MTLLVVGGWLGLVGWIVASALWGAWRRRHELDRRYRRYLDGLGRAVGPR